MASPPSSTNLSSPGLKNYFKSPEGRYKLQYEKTHSPGIIHYSQGKSVSQLSIAFLKEKQASHTSLVPSIPSTSSAVKSAAARLFVGVNGSKTFNFGGSNGGSKAVSGSNRFGGTFGASTGPGGTPPASNYDGGGSYLIFNVGDSLFISDLNSQNKDPIKSIHFSVSNPLCHAFDPDSKDGHDLVIGLHSGDIYTVSLRQQLQDPGKKLVGAQHYNKDGAINSSRCTCIVWVPDGDGLFVSAHADGNLYVYGKSKDGSIDPSFPAIKDPSQFSVSHARSSKCNPIIRWHISQGLINNISFSLDAIYLATVGRDGYLRVFDYHKEQLLFGGKSYYGALLCCAWSPDSKYILTGGEDDLVQVWSTEERKIVAWGEGHNSWVSGVSFDSYWSAPNPDGKGESVMYRFGSVGQDTQLLLWDLEMDEISLPPGYHSTGCSPTLSSGSPSAHWDTICPIGTLQPSPSMRDVPKISPLAIHRVHVDPLSGLIFTEESVVTICREGHIKIWARPGNAETGDAEISQSSFDSITNIASTTKERHDRHVMLPPSMKANGTGNTQAASIFFRN